MRELIAVPWKNFEWIQIAQSKDFLTGLNCPRSNTLTGQVSSLFDAHLICALFDGHAYINSHGKILEVWVSSKSLDALTRLWELVRLDSDILTDSVIQQVKNVYAVR